MISNRQLKVLIDLDSADEYVTGKSLSTKHNVSLRTIQNDIVVIKKIVNDLKFVSQFKEMLYT